MADTQSAPEEDKSSAKLTDAERKRLDEKWISESDPEVLDTTLQTFALDLERIRREPSKYSPSWTILFSIAIFVATIIGLTLAPIDEAAMTNLFQGFFDREAGADKIQFIILMSASAGIIPGIAYAILRDIEKERRNEELEALGLKLRYIRSRILLLRQEKAVKDIRRT